MNKTLLTNKKINFRKIFINGVIYTFDKQNSIAQALVIENTEVLLTVFDGEIVYIKEYPQ